MDIASAKQQIKNTVQIYLQKDALGRYRLPLVHQRPIFLLGAPGLGKTAIMQQVADEMGLGLVSYSMTHHTRQSALGLPVIVEKEYGGKHYQVSEYTMSEIIASVYDCMRTTGKTQGILFLDEINCVSETLSPAMLLFLQYKVFGGHQIPEGWVVVTAGNPPRFNKSVREFDAATRDRLKVIEVEPSYEAWKAYALEHGVSRSVISYLDIRPEDFYKVETTVDGLTVVTPRAWEDLSEILQYHEELGLAVSEELTTQYLQNKQVARDFAIYYELYQKYRQAYNIDAILQGVWNEDVLTQARSAKMDERMSLVSLLLAGLNTRFAAARRADAVTDACYQEMRSFKRTLNNADPAQDGFVPAAVFAAQVNVYADHLTAQKAAGTLTGEELAVVTTASALLHAWAAALDPALDRDAAFDAVRASFNAQVRKREDAVGLAGDALESAFDFMESAFADGQEMVVFVNELALGPDSAAYLADNECERFETYIIKGERGSGKICLNGAAARKVQPDDIVIIMSYALMDFEEAKSFKPTVIFPDPETNKVVK